MANQWGYEKSDRPFRFRGTAGEAFRAEQGWPSRGLDHNGWYLDPECPESDDCVVGVVFQVSSKGGSERYLAGVEDGEPYANKVTVEKCVNGRWVTVREYDGGEE